MRENELLEIVRDHLNECTRHGAPPLFTSIEKVRPLGSGKVVPIEARLMMFDGVTAKVVVTPVGGTGLWSHRFEELPGGDVYLQDGRWRRVKPEQLSLF